LFGGARCRPVAVVDHDDLKIAMALGASGAKGTPKKGGSVFGRYDHAEQNSILFSCGGLGGRDNCPLSSPAIVVTLLWPKGYEWRVRRL
jgi:hypothetical protein